MTSCTLNSNEQFSELAQSLFDSTTLWLDSVCSKLSGGLSLVPKVLLTVQLSGKFLSYSKVLTRSQALQVFFFFSPQVSRLIWFNDQLTLLTGFLLWAGFGSAGCLSRMASRHTEGVSAIKTEDRQGKKLIEEENLNSDNRSGLSDRWKAGYTWGMGGGGWCYDTCVTATLW